MKLPGPMSVLLVPIQDRNSSCDQLMDLDLNSRIKQLNDYVDVFDQSNVLQLGN
jgi:hypothetical protein